LKNFNYKEFSIYFVIGGMTTVIDWSIFAIATFYLNLHYFIALVASMGLSGIFHYLASKQLAFQCSSQQYKRQISFYILVALAGFSLTYGTIHLLISIFKLQALLARIFTTIFMLPPNYLMHKNITFNRKIFL